MAATALTHAALVAVLLSTSITAQRAYDRAAIAAELATLERVA